MLDTATPETVLDFGGPHTFNEVKHRINREVELSDFGRPIRIELRGPSRRHMKNLLKWVAECGVHGLALSQSAGRVTITYTVQSESCTVLTNTNAQVGNGVTYSTEVEGVTVSSIFIPQHFTTVSAAELVA
jgi:hypothetical protein